MLGKLKDSCFLIRDMCRLLFNTGKVTAMVSWPFGWFGLFKTLHNVKGCVFSSDSATVVIENAIPKDIQPVTKMAMRHFGPRTEPPTASHTSLHLPPNLTYGHWYPKYITFWVKSTKFEIFHYWGCVSPHLWRASWPLAPRLVVTLQSLITTNHN